MRSRTRSAARGRGHACAPAGSVRLSRQARVAKALLVASLSTLIALVSHVLAGGSVPALPGILVPLTFSALACVPLSGRVLSLPRLVLSVAASQLLFHWLFVLGVSGSEPLAVEGAHAGHHAEAATVLGTAAGAHAGHSDGWMWVAHGVAAIATVVLIRRGEAALVALWRLTVLLVRTLFPRIPRTALVRVAPPRLRGTFPDAGALARWLLEASISRRGPPRASVIAPS